jgi:CheY-like chemotaxis protein
MVSMHGHTVDGMVDRSSDCIEWCSESPPDLVLVDLNLADGATGLSLIEELAEQGIPALIVSNKAMMVPQTTSAKGVIGKPVHECELTMALDRLT